MTPSGAWRPSIVVTWRPSTCAARVTAQYPFAIDMDGAGAALAVVTPLLGAGKIGVFAKCVEQGHPCIELEVMMFAIDFKGQCSSDSHRASFKLSEDKTRPLYGQ
jgi:hypothetical protein